MVEVAGVVGTLPMLAVEGGSPVGLAVAQCWHCPGVAWI